MKKLQIFPLCGFCLLFVSYEKFYAQLNGLLSWSPFSRGRFLITASRVYLCFCTFLFSNFWWPVCCVCVASRLSIVCTFCRIENCCTYCINMKYFPYALSDEPTICKIKQQPLHHLPPDVYVCVYTIQYLFVRFTWLHSTWIALQLPFSSVFCLFTMALWFEVRAGKRFIQYYTTEAQRAYFKLFQPFSEPKTRVFL